MRMPLNLTLLGSAVDAEHLSESEGQARPEEDAREGRTLVMAIACPTSWSAMCWMSVRSSASKPASSNSSVEKRARMLWKRSEEDGGQRRQFERRAEGRGSTEFDQLLVQGEVERLEVKVGLDGVVWVRVEQSSGGLTGPGERLICRVVGGISWEGAASSVLRAERKTPEQLTEDQVGASVRLRTVAVRNFPPRCVDAERAGHDLRVEERRAVRRHRNDLVGDVAVRALRDRGVGGQSAPTALTTEKDG